VRPARKKRSATASPQPSETLTLASCRGGDVVALVGPTLHGGTMRGLLLGAGTIVEVGGRIGDSVFVRVDGGVVIVGVDTPVARLVV
jgi:hypothetical protein